MPTHETTLTSIEIEPSAPAEHSIIWLHGLGADSNDFVPLATNIDLPAHLNVRFIFPDAPMMPITINNGYVMRAWYDITSITSIREVDTHNIQQSQALIRALIAKEIARGIPPQHILLGGFPQGAVMALFTGLRYQAPLAGIVALSGYLPVDPSTAPNQQTPIFIAHGTEDTIVPYALGKAAGDALAAAHFPVTWRSYPIGHTVSSVEIQEIRAWLITHAFAKK